MRYHILFIAAVTAATWTTLPLASLAAASPPLDDYGVDVLDLPVVGADDGPRLIAALAACPSDACAIRLPSGRALRLEQPVILHPHRSLTLSGIGTDQSRLTVLHRGVALTIVQDSACDATHLENFTLQGSAVGGGPIAGGIKIDYSRALPCASPPPPVTLRGIDIRAANDPRGLSSPFPGSFLDAVTLVGRFPTMLGGVLIDGLNVQASLKSAPAPDGSHCLTLALIDDIQARDFTCLYADVALYQIDYGEGFRLDTVSWLGTNCGWCQGPAAQFSDPLGIHLFTQKAWIKGAEINTFACGICLSLVSDSFISNGEIVRYANSHAAWYGVKLTDSYLWHFSSDFSFDNLVGQSDDSYGIHLSERTKGRCFQNGGVGNHFARLATSIFIGPGCSGNQFIFPVSMDNTLRETAPYVDQSMNRSNRFIWTSSRETGWVTQDNAQKQVQPWAVPGSR